MKILLRTLNKYQKMLRLEQWVKNLMIFIPCIFSGALFSLDSYDWYLYLIGFLSFSLLSSAVYIVNDIVDRDRDRQHTKKRCRPIASGDITVLQGKIWSAALFLISGMLCVDISEVAGWPPFCFWIVYVITNIFYSVIGLKKYPVIDIFLLASFYIIRLYFGAGIENIEISSWLFMVTFTGALFIGAEKRNSELIMEGEDVRSVLKKYKQEFLKNVAFLMASLCIIFYSLWSTEKERLYGINTFLTVPIVLFLIVRYAYDVEVGQEGEPLQIVRKDPMILGGLILYLGAIFYLFYS